jgi:pyruvate,water dikinase
LRGTLCKFLIIKKVVVMSNLATTGVHQAPDKGAAYVVSFENLRMTDVESVGGKNASLGEMISQLAHAGVRVPGGFATTAQAFRDFLSYSNGGPSLADRIAERLAGLNIDDVRALAAAGAQIRQWILDTPFQSRLENEISDYYHKLVDDSSSEMSFAVRSSATAEDLPDASFAGQQETFLNVVGIDNVLEAIKHVFSSLYNDRAISYRVHKGFTHAEVALSAGIQRMVRSDLGAAGVMFTIDTESGFKDVVFITSSYGLGETVVQGAVNPDEFYVHKPMLEAGKLPIIRRNIGSKLIKMEFTGEAKAGRSVRTVDVPIELRNRYSLNETEIAELATYAVIIEKHYARPMDIEWGKDGRDGKIYILQARPETVKSQENHSDVQQKFKLKGSGNVLTHGRAIGQKIGAGPVRVINDPSEMERVQPGDVLMASTGGFTGCAITGDLVLGMAKNCGAVGFVTDGCVRDLVGLRTVGLPAWAIGVTPNSPQRHRPGTIGFAIALAGHPVASGDIVVADLDGVVVVPQARIAEVLARLPQIRAAEARADAAVRDGARLPSFLAVDTASAAPKP